MVALKKVKMARHQNDVDAFFRFSICEINAYKTDHGQG